mgnify:CR=1 FL=1
MKALNEMTVDELKEEYNRIVKLLVDPAQAVNFAAYLPKLGEEIAKRVWAE